MQAIDNVKPRAKTRLEDFERWVNWTQAKFLTTPFSPRLVIHVKTDEADEEFTQVWTEPTEPDNHVYTDDEFGSDAQALADTYESDPRYER